MQTLKSASVLAFHGGKGGVGTTTLAAETATFLSGRGYRVAAVDLNLYGGDLHHRLDVPLSKGTYTIADLLPVLNEVDGRILENALTVSAGGVLLLPAPQSAQEAESVRESHITKLLSKMRQKYDYVVADTPPALTRTTHAVLGAADLVVLLVIPELSCLAGARRALSNMADSPVSTQDIALAVNRSLGSADSFTVPEIESLLDLKAIAALPEDAAGCRRAGDEGRLLIDERTALGRAVREFARRLESTSVRL